MKARHEIQPHAVSLIQAHAYFSGHTVLENVGLSTAAIAAAIKSKGFCIWVNPLAGAVRQGTGGNGKSPELARVVVQWKFNARRNAQQNAPLAIYHILSAVENALLTYAPINPNDRYTCHEVKYTEQVQEGDDGLFCYLQQFEKLCVPATPPLPVPSVSSSRITDSGDERITDSGDERVTD